MEKDEQCSSTCLTLSDDLLLDILLEPSSFASDAGSSLLDSSSDSEESLPLPLSETFLLALFETVPFEMAPFEMALFKTAPFEMSIFETAIFKTALFETALFKMALFETTPFLRRSSSMTKLEAPSFTAGWSYDI